MEPNNQQAKQLKKLITDKIRTGLLFSLASNIKYSMPTSFTFFTYYPLDTMITAGVVGGAALVGAVAIGGVALLAAGVTKLIKR